MKVGYGSDVHEAAAFVRRVPAVRHSPSASHSNSSKAKRVLAIVGVTAVAGGALVAYHAVNTNSHATTLLDVQPLTLEANVTAATASASSSVDALLLGTPFQLRMPQKNLCVDDGGGTGNGQTKFVLAPCDLESANQFFTYDTALQQLRSRDKLGKCVDDGGARRSGEAQLHLWDCHAGHPNQQFVYDPSTELLRAAVKGDLCIDDGGGSVAGETKLHLWACHAGHANQQFEIVPTATYNVPENLRDGQEVVLALTDKHGLCLDDGGGTSSGHTKFINANCDGSSANQIFVYDSKTFQFRSARKPNLCLDDAGTQRAGDAHPHLFECDVRNGNQRFIYEKVTQTIRNPTKNLCVDDGGGMQAGQSLYTLQPCAVTSPNQRFSILSRAEAAQITQAKPAATWVVDHPVLLSGDKFVLRAHGKNNLCVDDGGGQRVGDAQFHLWDCSMDNMNQVFRYDPATFMVHSVAKAGLCMDDGGGKSNGATKFRLWPCDVSSDDQKFLYDTRAQLFRNPTKPHMCMDDGGAKSNGAAKFHLWDCAETNVNQLFSVQPWGPGTPGAVAAAHHVPEYLRAQQKVLIFAASKPGLCVDDGGGSTNGQTKFVDAPCNGASQNQIFVYDPVHYMFRSAHKPNMCLDDGGSATTNHTQFHLWGCDLGNDNQRFIYEEATQHVRNPVKNWCMDGTNGQYTMQQCEATNANQRFAILWQSEVGGHFVEQQISPEDMKLPAGHPILETTEEFMLRVPGKRSMCVDDGGSAHAGHTQLHLWTCDPSNPNQVFRYDVATNAIRSATKGNLCVDDGGGRSRGETKFRLGECHAQDTNQKFVYEWTAQRFFNPHKPNLCMDDGGGVSNGETKFHLWDCDANSRNQQFEIIPRAAFGGLQPPVHVPGMPTLPANGTVDPALMNGRKVLLRHVSKGNMCVDDGVGRASGEGKFHLLPCEPLHANQQFVFDGATLRSAVKEGLCVDDGGGRANGETKFHLRPCDAASDNQKFTYAFDTMMFSSVAKPGMCMDDGGGPSGGRSRFHLWECDAGNFNQKFEMMPVDALDGAPPGFGGGGVPPSPPPPGVRADVWPVDHPILLSGEVFMMTVPGKEQFCVDDGGGRASGETKFHLAHCDATNPGQAFRYEATTNSIRSAVKGDLCVDDGGGRTNGETKIHLWQCDPHNVNQKFVYDWNKERFFNPLKPKLCMDDGGGGVAAGEPKFHLWECDASNRNQRFGILRLPTVVDPMPPTPPTPPTQPLEPLQPIVPTSIGEGSGGGQPVPNPVDPANPNPNPVYVKSEFDEGDWNLLGPSNDTIAPVNADGSEDITSAEIYAYLVGIKEQEDKHHAKMMFKYRRTFQCVTDGLASLAKDTVTASEYHALVAWMYEHCVFEGRTAAPVPTEPGVPPTVEPVVVDRVYMTKLEFYQQIRDHFGGLHAGLIGQAESAQLRAGVTNTRSAQLASCVKQASHRFGRANEYEQPEHFHKAIQWIQNECMANASAP